MKTPKEIKKGLEYASTTNIARKVAIAKAGRMPYEYAEEAAADALAYIHQLESKLAEYEKPLVPLTFDEAILDDSFLERKDGSYVDMALNNFAFDDGKGEGSIYFTIHNGKDEHLLKKDYNKTWRCWPRKPTDEERKAAKWDD